jgi:hypothetical protein
MSPDENVGHPVRIDVAAARDRERIHLAVSNRSGTRAASRRLAGDDARVTARHARRRQSASVGAAQRLQIARAHGTDREITDAVAVHVADLGQRAAETVAEDGSLDALQDRA